VKVWDIGSVFYYPVGNPVFPASLVEELFPAHILVSFVKNEMAVAMWVCVSVFNSCLFLISKIYRELKKKLT
jgi:hypothetical protein